MFLYIPTDIISLNRNTLELLLTVCLVVFHMLHMSSDIGLVSSLFQHQLRTFLHLVLDCLVTSPLYLLDTLLLSLEYLLCLHDCAALILCQELIDGAIRVDRMLTGEETSSIGTRLVGGALRRPLIEGLNGVEGAYWVLFSVDHAMRI